MGNCRVALKLGGSDLIKMSTDGTTEIKRNAAKYLSYREAWCRIKVAQEQDFYMEAVTVEESLIGLRSVLCRIA